MKHIIILILVCGSASVAAQTGPFDTLFVLSARYSSFFSVDDTTYSGTATIKGDQLGQGYHGLMVQVGDIAGDQFGRLYRIDSIITASRQRVTFECVQLQNSVGGPNVQGMISRANDNGILPLLPQNGDGITPQLAARVQNNNIARIKQMIADSISNVRATQGETAIIARDSLSKKTYTTDTRLIVREDGYEYKINTDSIYDVDGVFVVERDQGNYAIYDNESVISKTNLGSVAFAKLSNKRLVINDTIVVSGSIDFDDIDLTITESGFIQGADTIFSSATLLHANPNQQLWSSTTIIEGDWKNKNSYMEWTIGDVTTDSVANYRALKNAIQIQSEGVILKAKEYPIAGSSNTDTRVTDKDIIIKGVNRKLSKIRLITKHTYNSIADNAYFRNDVGNNVHFENFTLLTTDFTNGIQTNINVPYAFISARRTTGTPNTKPNIDFVVYDRMNMKGVMIPAGVSIDSINQVPSDYVNNSIRKIEIDNCEFEGMYGVFGLAGMRVDQMNFTNNFVKNTKGSTIGRSGGATKPEMFDSIPPMKVYIANNRWVNDSVINGRDFSYLSPVVFQQGAITFENNYVEGLRSRTELTEVYPWYITSNDRVIIKDNTFKNIFGKQSNYGAYAFDLKGNTNQAISGNKFTIDKQVLIDVGLIDSLTQDLTTLKDTLKYSLMKINPDDNAIKQRDLTIKDNIINVPFVNGHTDIHTLSRFEFTNNTIKIGHFGAHKAGGYGGGQDSEGTIFWNRTPAEVAIDNKNNWVSKGNNWSIEYSEVDKIYYNKGSAFSSSTDVTVAFSDQIISDNWGVSNAEVLYTLADAQRATIKTVMTGENSSVGIDRISSSVTLRPPVATTNFDVKVNDYYDHGTDGFAASYTNSSYKLHADRNSSDTIRIFKHIRNDALFQNKDSLPLRYELELIGLDTLNQQIKKSYEWYLGAFREWRYVDVSGNNSTKDGDSGFAFFRDTLFDKYQVDGGIYLILEQYFLGSGQTDSRIKLGGTSKLNSFDVSLTIERASVSTSGAIDAILSLPFAPLLHEKNGKELTLESATNPYGSDDELGAIINDMATADSYATIASGNTITRKSVMYVDASLESTATLTRSGSGIPTNTDVVINVKNAGTVTISDSGGANLTFNDPNIADKSSWIVGPGEYVFRWLPNSWIVEDLPDRYYDGWADYTDTTYTSASPLSLTASTKITLPNHAQIIRDSEIPIDIDSLFSIADTTITGRNGDGLNVLIEFKVKPTTAAVTKITVTIDIGGTVGEIYPRDFILTKGNGVEHYYLSSFGAYTLDTWETNGGKVKIVSDAAADVYDIRYVLTRTHKAKY